MNQKQIAYAKARIQEIAAALREKAKAKYPAEPTWEEKSDYQKPEHLLNAVESGMIALTNDQKKIIAALRGCREYKIQEALNPTDVKKFIADWDKRVKDNKQKRTQTLIDIGKEEVRILDELILRDCDDAMTAIKDFANFQI